MELTMILKLKPKIESCSTNCPRCLSTNTFQTTLNDARYCINCRKLYDRKDEVRLRERQWNEAQSIN